MTEFTVNSEIIIKENIFELYENLSFRISELVNNSGNDFYLALSGGETPRLFFRYLAENYKSKIEWNKIKFFWVDERCVPPHDPESNYRMTKENLLSLIPVKEKNIFRIEGENDPSEEAFRYSRLLADNVPSSNKYPRFDLILLGLGDDGHTASIFPDNIGLINDKRFCAVSGHPVTHQKRITLTGSVINNAKNIFFHVTGTKKKDIVKSILLNEAGTENFPASHINPPDGYLYWFLDGSAGRLLSI